MSRYASYAVAQADACVLWMRIDLTQAGPG